MKLSRTNRWPVGLLELAVAGLGVWIACGPRGLPGAEPKERILCDIEDPQIGCPGPGCPCVEDRLEVTFDGASSILELDRYVEGTTIDVVVMMDVVAQPVEGWIYGIAHDVEALTVTAVTTAGTDAEALYLEGNYFNATEMEGIQTCLTEECHKDVEGERRDGGGWISAIVMDFEQRVTLPIGRSSVARATYRLDQDVGTEGTTLQIADWLARRGGPRIRNALTSMGKNRLWSTVVDGWIRIVNDASDDLRRTYCDPEDPVNDCPGPDCPCLNGSLEVTFDGASPVLELDRFTEGSRIEAVIVMDVASESLESWSYGIAHDESALSVTSVTTVNTDVSGLLEETSGYRLMQWEDVQTCLTDRCSPDEPDDRAEGGGWLTAIVIDFVGGATLPPGRYSVARATYTLQRDVGQEGTFLEVSDRLARRGWPRNFFGVNVEGVSRQWTAVADGWIRILGPDPSERRRLYCDPEHPSNECPGSDCRCVDDTLEITFDGGSDSILEYETFEKGKQIEAVLVLDVVSEELQGWSYGVAHDEDFLTVDWATSEGTDVEGFLGETPFLVNHFTGIQTCLNERCSRYEADGDRRDGGGFIGATVLEFMGGSALPVGRHSFARAGYSLQREVGPRGTFLELTDSLALWSQPRVESAMTIDGKNRLWSTVVDGWIRRAPGSDLPFRRGDVGVSGPGKHHFADGLVNIGDAVRILYQLFWNDEGYELDCEKAADVDDDGMVTINDSMTLLRFLFMGGARPAEPFEAAGLDGTDDGLTCERFP